jgi:hypothetical protein
VKFTSGFGVAGAEIGRYYDFLNGRVRLARFSGRREHERRKVAGIPGGAMGDLEPIAFPEGKSSRPSGLKVTFDRRELMRILELYGRKVAAGEWRDYAIAFLRDRAVFSVFRRSSEMPLYRIEKNMALARRQGAYAVVAASGLVLKRGHSLDRVLRAIDPLRVVN